jgi:hypothetical protein
MLPKEIQILPILQITTKEIQNSNTTKIYMDFGFFSIPLDWNNFLGKIIRLWKTFQLFQNFVIFGFGISNKFIL